MKVFQSFLLLFTFNILLMIQAVGQELNETVDLVTDRPDQTESSVAVPTGTFQLETGFSYASNSQDLFTEKSTSYGGTLLRYGIFVGMELRIGLDYGTVSTQYHVSPPPDVMQRGVSPLMLGAKLNLTEQRGWIPEMALLVHVQTSLLNSDFAIDYAVPNIIISASHVLTSRISLGYNLGMEWENGAKPPTKIYSAVAGFGLSEKTGFFLETFGSFGESCFENMIDGGFTILMLPNLQYDISGGFGLTDSSPDFFIATGLSIRLP